MIITTTEFIENRKIIQYLDPISKYVVLGSNVFSDIGASIVDLVGGRSSSYEGKLSRIYSNVIDQLRKEGKSLRADALVGLKVDIDEISGGGKQMFMITALATPVVLDKIVPTNTTSSFTLSGSIISSKLRAKQIIDMNVPISQLSNDEVAFVYDSGYPELHSLVLNHLGDDTISNGESGMESKLQKISEYFSRLDEEESIEILYNQLALESTSGKQRYRVFLILKAVGLIDHSIAINLLLKGGTGAKRSALFILNESQKYYSQDDVLALNSVSDTGIIRLFEDIVEFSEEKSLFGGREVWKCECGNKNGKVDQYCSCGRDKRGINPSGPTPETVQVLINLRLEVIKDLQNESVAAN